MTGVENIPDVIQANTFLYRVKVFYIMRFNLSRDGQGTALDRQERIIRLRGQRVQKCSWRLNVQCQNSRYYMKYYITLKCIETSLTFTM